MVPQRLLPGGLDHHVGGLDQRADGAGPQGHRSVAAHQHAGQPGARDLAPAQQPRDLGADRPVAEHADPQFGIAVVPHVTHP